MRKLRFSVQFLLAAIVILALASTAEAQATRTWVSGVGDDANPCSRTAPCKTFAGAISKTAVNGEINCLDPGGFGAVTITKSITIDCHEIFASILNSGTNGIIINFDSFGGTDTRKTVRLRNLNINGANTGANGIRILGTTNSAGSEVYVEDCLIDGMFLAGQNQRGIDDVRVNGGQLGITNTTIRNCGGSGVSVNPASGSTAINVTADNLRIYNCSFGFAISKGVRATVKRSNFSGNTNGGIYSDSVGGGTSELTVDDTVSANNGIGVQNGGGTTTIRLSNCNIINNTTAVSGVANSFGNNRVAGGAGALTAIGADSHDKGQT